jgi:hypothetical protein
MANTGIDIMKLLILMAMLFTVSGCDSLGDIIREKKYTLQIHETPNSKQEFGYNEDHDYVGFMMHGKFGAILDKHTHSDYCKHNLEDNL